MSSIDLFSALFIFSVLTGNAPAPAEGQEYKHIPTPEHAPELYSGCLDGNETQQCWYVL